MGIIFPSIMIDLLLAGVITAIGAGHPYVARVFLLLAGFLGYHNLREHCFPNRKQRDRTHFAFVPNFQISWPLLARAGATLILPAVVVVPVVITCWWSDLLDCLAHLFVGFTGPAPWVVYSLWLIGLAFQYGLWRYKKGSGRDKELGEVGWSVGFYFVMVLVVFLSVVLLSIGE